MNKYNKGSLWRRWDLQVQPIQNRWLTAPHDNHDKIKKSCEEFIKKASERSISVVGITDHNTGFAIDICQEISDNKNIVILPGVELDTPEGWHILVFFNKDYKMKLKCDKWSEVVDTFLLNICNINRPFYKNGDTSEKIGITTLDLLKKIKAESIGLPIFAHCYAEAGFFRRGDASSRLDILRAHKNNEVDFLFEIKDKYSQLEDIKKKLRDWKYNPNLFGILSSSDAHNAGDVGTCFSWIKADPSFSGLKQTLYEPTERVIVQEEIPDSKVGYQVIDRIEIGYSDIGNNIIELNPGLNCIIGGRSTGKSVLLASIAKKLKDAAKAKEHNEKYNEFVGNISKSLKLIWKDGIEDDEREIEFFNQGYMNEYSREENIKKFDDLVRDILKEKNNGNLFEEYDDFVEKNKTEIQAEINHLYNFLHKISEREQEIKDIGDIEGIDLEIKSLEEKIAGIKKSNQFSEQDYEDFQSKKELLTTTKTEREHLSSDKDNIPKITRELSITPLPSYWNELSEEYKKVVEEIYEKAKTAFFKTWNEEITLVNSKIDTAISDLKAKEEAIQNEESYKKGVKILESNNVLNTLEKRLTSEKEKKRNIEELKAEITRLQKDVETAKQKIIDKHKLFYSEAKRIADSLTTELEDNSLKILAYPRFLEKEYRDLLHYAINLQGTERKNQADYRYSDNENYVKEFTEKFEELLKDKIVLKNGFNGRKLIERILPESNYTVSYEVHYEGDKYSEMSEGKQAFVVLKLLLDFSDRKCPIFIDQPEDDLDNRAIFNDLVTYLRKKKKERQIIVVTHNPNIVVGTDAELVLVANQHGVKNKNNGNKKFNYAVGSIEHSIPVDKDNPIVLERQGIREHICEILEGGETAFKKREKRYDIKS